MMTQATKEIYAEAWMYYLSGNFTIKQIAEILDFPLSTLATHAGRNGWARMRSRIHKEAGKGLKENLAQRIEQARIKHQNFMLDQLDETADGIESKVVGEIDPEDAKGEAKVTVSQKIDLIDRQHQVASKVLKLDDIKDHDPNKIGFAFLYGLATNTLPAKTNANAGILRSNNAYPEGHVTPENGENMKVLEVVDGVARPVEQPEEDLVQMLRSEGYDAHDISHMDHLPATPDDITPPPIKLSFQTPRNSNGEGGDSNVQSSTIPNGSGEVEGGGGGVG